MQAPAKGGKVPPYRDQLAGYFPCSIGFFPRGKPVPRHGDENQQFNSRSKNRSGHCDRTIAMREQISEQLKTAMKAGDKRRVSTLRMIQSTLKDRDIEARTADKPVSDADILAMLQKMIKSRQESADIYAKNNRPELAQQENEEIAIISEFLPKQMSEDEVAEAIKAAIGETGAASMKDMGKVIGALKANYSGQMDFGKASAIVKARLSG